MIFCEEKIIIAADQKYWQIPLNELCKNITEAVSSRQEGIYLPCLQRKSKADDYIRWGFYQRKNILDIRTSQDKDGNVQYIEDEIRDLKIQRIRVRKNGKTHAVLTALFVPYYAALDAAGCKRREPYCCRHTTATALAIDENVAPQTVQRIMRWASTRMLDRYAHPDDAHALEAIESLTKNK